MVKRILFAVFIIRIATAALIRPPYLQNVTQTGIKVMWGSDQTNGMVYWGHSPASYTDSVFPASFLQPMTGAGYITATITGLSISDTIYYYVKNGSENIGYDDPAYYAVTAPAGDASFRFITFGDRPPRNLEQIRILNRTPVFRQR